MPVEEIEAKNFFNFMCFHGPSAAQPHGWPVLMKNGKVSSMYVKVGSPGIPVVTGQNLLSRHAKPLEILGRPSNDVPISREFRESHFFSSIVAR